MCTVYHRAVIAVFSSHPLFCFCFVCLCLSFMSAILLFLANRSSFFCPILTYILVPPFSLIFFRFSSEHVPLAVMELEDRDVGRFSFRSKDELIKVDNSYLFTYYNQKLISLQRRVGTCNSSVIET